MAEKTNYATMTEDDLKNRLVDVEQELSSARLRHRIGQFKKTSDFGKLRKEVARINTILRSKQVKVA